MDRKKLIKHIGIAVDILMYTLLLVQMLYVFTGNNLHELLGIGFFLCLVVHIILKRKFLPGLLRFKGKSAQRILADISTLLITAVSVVMMLSGMGVSRILFPWFRYVTDTDLHTCLATALLTLSVLHGGMNGYIRTKKKKRAALLIALGCAASIAAGLALVPYLDRHFKTVRIDYAKTISGEKVEWKNGNTLVVYFTRNGNTDFDDDVDAVSGASLLIADGVLMGSNQLIADMIQDAVGCDVKAITLTGKKYPSSYGDTVAVAGKELSSDSRPETVPVDTAGYDSVILVYPLWWGTVPMPVASFLESSDLKGKDLYLIATQGSSGYGRSAEDIEDMAKGADVHKVMSIYCDDIPYSREVIGEWLKELNAEE